LSWSTSRSHDENDAQKPFWLEDYIIRNLHVPVFVVTSSEEKGRRDVSSRRAEDAVVVADQHPAP
jgi:hypothetical protein